MLRTKFRNRRSGGALTQDYDYKGSRRRNRSGSRQESREAFVNTRGEISASNTSELREKVAAFIQDVLEGNVDNTPRVADTQNDESARQEQIELVEAAMNDRTMAPGGAFVAMGETIGDAIWETTGRLGFGRKFLLKMDVERGQEGRFRVRQQNVVSHIVTKDSYVPRVVVNQPYLYPDVLTLPTYVTISDNENATAPVEFMDEKFQDGLTATLVREDNIIRYLFTQGAAVYNDVFTFTDLTPALWSTQQIQVSRWGLPVPHCLVAIDLWTDMRTNTDFQNVYEPVSKLQLIEEGRLGKLYDTEIYTDGLRYDTLQVLQPGEIFFLASPIGLGGIADYEELQTEPVSLHHIGVSARGWYMWQSSGYILGNSRGVSYGFRSS